MQRLELTLCEDNNGDDDFVYKVKTAIEYQAKDIEAWEIKDLFAIFIQNVKCDEDAKDGA